MIPLQGKTLLVFPCCKKKRANGAQHIGVVPPQFWAAIATLERRPCVKVNGLPTPALWLYKGFLYGQLDKTLLAESMADGSFDVVILSGGYGLTHAYEKIKGYEATMDEYYDDWDRERLPDVLKQYIELTKPDNVIAFFTHNNVGSYGNIYDSGVSEVFVSGVIGRYTAKTMPGSAVALGQLGRLVTKVVRNRGLIVEPNIPFIRPDSR